MSRRGFTLVQGRMLRRYARGGFAAWCVGLPIWLVSQMVGADQPSPAPAAAPKATGLVAEFEIEKGFRPIILPVKLGGREHSFILDTGDSFVSLDTSFKPLLGKLVDSGSIQTADGDVPAELFDPPEMFLGKLDLRSGGPVHCADLDGMRRVLGRDIRGVIGMSFLRSHVVRVDFDGGKIQFRAWDGRRHPEWGNEVQLFSGDHVDSPFVKASLPGIGEFKFLVDLGYSQSVGVETTIFLKAASNITSEGGYSQTLAGTREKRTGRLEKLVLGGIEHPGSLVDEQGFNMLGLGLFARHVVTFDFPGMKMYLQKGRAFDAPETLDMSGLHLWCVEGRIEVHSVDKNSPASAAGIKPDDVVLKVGNMNASPKSLLDLRDLLKSGDGRKIGLTWRRGAEEMSSSLKLKQKL